MYQKLFKIRDAEMNKGKTSLSLLSPMRDINKNEWQMTYWT